MKSLFMALCFISTSAFAESFTSTIHSIEAGKGNEPYLVKHTNGRVSFVEKKQADLIQHLRDSKERKEAVEVEVDSRNTMISVQTSNKEHDLEDEIGLPDLVEDEEKVASYVPTVLPSYNSALKVFRNMRRDYQRESQCYNRAHVWQYEEFKRSQLKSMKLFLFFTSRYIRNYRYHWWFHVTPMVSVKQSSGVTSMALDRRYTSGPLRIKSWTDRFIYSKRTCPTVSRYADYRNNQEKEDCYLIPVSMYFWQPRDIERRDRTGYEKKQFFPSEINHAYWEAF